MKKTFLIQTQNDECVHTLSTVKAKGGLKSLKKSILLIFFSKISVHLYIYWCQWKNLVPNY